MPISFYIFRIWKGLRVAVSSNFVHCVRPATSEVTKIEFDGSRSVSVKANLIDVTLGLRAGRD